MKKLIIVLLVLYVNVLFGQENPYYKKHNIFLDVGINHSANFKLEYHPASRWPPDAETLSPGYYSFPVFNFKTNINYRLYVYRGFNITTGLNTLFLKNITTRSVDSLNKYYLYSDSVIENFPFEYKGLPKYSKSNRFHLSYSLSLGYQYKRFSISAGINIPIFKLSNQQKIFKDNTSKNTQYVYGIKKIHDYSFVYIGNVRLEFLLLKKKVPLSIYLEANEFIFGGIIFNFYNTN